MQVVTDDHNQIKQWVEKHNGNPQLIDHPEAKSDDLGIRINIPGHEDDALLSDAHPPKNISWDEFFRIFDAEDLEFIYDDEQYNDNPSYSYRFMKKNVNAPNITAEPKSSKNDDTDELKNQGGAGRFATDDLPPTGTNLATSLTEKINNAKES